MDWTGFVKHGFLKHGFVKYGFENKCFVILFLEDIFLGKIRCLPFRRVNFCKDHRDKIEVPDPLVVEDLNSDKLNN